MCIFDFLLSWTCFNALLQVLWTWSMLQVTSRFNQLGNGMTLIG